jgi:hypothetical protein
MKKTILVIFSLVLCVLGVWLFWSEPTHAQVNTSAVASNVSATLTPLDNNPQLTVNKLPIKQATKKHFNDSIKDAAKQVSLQYAEALKFPPYSQPLTVYDQDRLEPNKFHPVSVPVNNQGDRLSLSLSQYRFVYPEPIDLIIEGSNIDSLNVVLMSVDTKEVLAEKQVSNSQQSTAISFPAREDYPRNLQIVTKADIDSTTVPVVAQLQYMPPSAVITGLESAWANNDKMVIPVNLKVQKAGLYRVRANLYQGEQPFAHLVTRARLEQGTEQIELNAHWSVLPVEGKSMHLHGFVVELMSPAPGQPSTFGSSEVDSFVILDFPVDSLEKTTYQPSDREKQSLQFLQQLSTTG